MQNNCVPVHTMQKTNTNTRAEYEYGYDITHLVRTKQRLVGPFDFRVNAHAVKEKTNVRAVFRGPCTAARITWWGVLRVPHLVCSSSEHPPPLRHGTRGGPDPARRGAGRASQREFFDACFSRFHPSAGHHV